MKPFDPASFYRLADVHPRVPGVCLRTLKDKLSKLPRVKLSRRCVLYSGLVLNELFRSEHEPSVRVLPRRNRRTG